MKRLDHYWYSQNVIAWLLLPLSLVFCLLTMLRRMFYRIGLLKSFATAKPVIVVGNISVGGTGKTPLIVYLCQLLKQRGLKPGVISRGYGGHARNYPLLLDENISAHDAGDEPLLIAMRTDCPVAVGPDRIADIDCLLKNADVDIILADDGMQHYRLQRNAEIAVVDASRELGNGFCLPAGPLREPESRLDSVDLVIRNGGEANQASFTINAGIAISLGPEKQQTSLDDFSQQTVHAVAGIGNPQRFFDLLEQQGIRCIQHAFADHHEFTLSELSFDDGLPVLMTEKDAVKCLQFDLPNHWYVPVDVALSETAQQGINHIIEKVCNG